MKTQKLEDGLSRPVAALGGVMVLTGCALMVAGVAFAFSLTVMVWGSLLAAIATIVRYRGLTHQARIAALAEICRDGLPAHWSSADVVVLLNGYDK